MTRASIVVVHYGPAAMLERCLASLAEHALEAERIAVWNAWRAEEDPGLAEAFPEVRFLRNARNRGFSAAVNQGVAASSGRFVLLLNGDAALTAGALEKLLETAGGPGRAAAVGAQLAGPRGERRASWSGIPGPGLASLLPRRWREFLEGRIGERGVAEVPGLVGAAMLVSREAWETVGPFDERYFVYFVETDWCLRAARAGYRVFLHRDAEVVHEGGASSRDRRERAEREYEYARLRYVEKFWGAAAAARLRRLRRLRTWAGARSNALLAPFSPRFEARARRYGASHAWYAAGCPAEAGIASIEGSETGPL